MANVKWVDGFKVTDGDTWRVVESEDTISVANNLSGSGELTVMTIIKTPDGLKRAAIMVGDKVYKVEEVTHKFAAQIAELEGIVRELAQ